MMSLSTLTSPGSHREHCDGFPLAGSHHPTGTTTLVTCAAARWAPGAGHWQGSPASDLEAAQPRAVEMAQTQRPEHVHEFAPGPAPRAVGMPAAVGWPASATTGRSLQVLGAHHLGEASTAESGPSNAEEPGPVEAAGACFQVHPPPTSHSGALAPTGRVTGDRAGGMIDPDVRMAPAGTPSGSDQWRPQLEGAPGRACGSTSGGVGVGDSAQRELPMPVGRMDKENTTAPPHWQMPQSVLGHLPTPAPATALAPPLAPWPGPWDGVYQWQTAPTPVLGGWMQGGPGPAPDGLPVSGGVGRQNTPLPWHHFDSFPNFGASGHLNWSQVWPTQAASGVATGLPGSLSWNQHASRVPGVQWGGPVWSGGSSWPAPGASGRSWMEQTRPQHWQDSSFQVEGHPRPSPGPSTWAESYGAWQPEGVTQGLLVGRHPALPLAGPGSASAGAPGTFAGPSSASDLGGPGIRVFPVYDHWKLRATGSGCGDSDVPVGTTTTRPFLVPCGPAHTTAGPGMMLTAETPGRSPTTEKKASASGYAPRAAEFMSVPSGTSGLNGRVQGIPKRVRPIKVTESASAPGLASGLPASNAAEVMVAPPAVPQAAASSATGNTKKPSRKRSRPAGSAVPQPAAVPTAQPELKTATASGSSPTGGAAPLARPTQFQEPDSDSDSETEASNSASPTNSDSEPTGPRAASCSEPVTASTRPGTARRDGSGGKPMMASPLPAVQLEPQASSQLQVEGLGSADVTVKGTAGLLPKPLPVPFPVAKQGSGRSSTATDNLKPRRRHKCSFCPYLAKSRWEVSVHERTHTGNKPYQCSFCDYKANQRGNMRTHERRHTGEKPYKCPYCPYTSATSSCTLSHVRLHHRNLPAAAIKLF